RAQKRFTQSNGRFASAVELTRSLIQDKRIGALVAFANRNLVKAQKDLAAEKELVKKLARANTREFQKITNDVAAALNKAVKTDEQFVDLAFLLVLSRFPKANESKQAAVHLNKGQNRPTAASDIVWSLMNTKEFLMGP